MQRLRRLVVVMLVVLQIGWSSEHGMLMQPVNRGSAWRRGFDTPVNYNDNQNFCGGFGIQYQENDGKCGVCGDNYADLQPRDNENGGLYGVGVIVESYEQGQKIELDTILTANHKGYFEFSICPLSSEDEIESDECFDKYPILLENGSYQYQVPTGILGYHNLTGYLPDELKCEHCVLRWHYHAGNNWGKCSNGTEAVGCGNQEFFRTCSDIAIR